MRNTIALLDKALKLCSPATDYQLAKRLDISQSTIIRCRKHGGTLDNKAVLKLAKFIGQPFTEVLAMIELDRAKRETDRTFWELQAPRLLPSLVIAVLAAAQIQNGEISQGAAAFNVLHLQLIHYAH